MFLWIFRNYQAKLKLTLNPITTMNRICYLFACILVFTSGISNAQFTPVWDDDYQHTTAAGFSNEARKMVQDGSGNVFVLADVTSNINTSGNTTSNTYSYSVILKYSPAGALLQTRLIEVVNHSVTGFDYFSAFGLRLDDTGNVYVGYNYDDPGNGVDVRLTKFNNNLVFQFTLKYATLADEYGSELVVDPNGEAFIIARTENGANDQYHILKSDYTVYQLNVLSSFVAATDILLAMTTDESSKVFVTGYRLVSGFKTVLTASINYNGIVNWSGAYNGGSSSRDDIGKSIIIGADGGLYIIGTSDQGPPNGNDIMVMKCKLSTGKKTWVTFSNTGSNDQGIFIDGSNSNYIYTGGVSGNLVVLEMFSGATGARKGHHTHAAKPAINYNSIQSVSLDAWHVSSYPGFYITGTIAAKDVSNNDFTASYLAKYIFDTNVRGGYQLAYEIDAPGSFTGSYKPAALLLDAANTNVYWLRSYTSTFTSHTNETVVLNQFDVPAPVRLLNNNTNDQLTVQISPNPASNFIFINSNLEIHEIKLMDISGKEILSSKGTGNSSELQVEGIVPGMYLLKVAAGDEVQVSTIIIK